MATPLSDLGCDDMPTPWTTHLEEGLQLDFDDILDIALEFEFTHTITHIWPCEDEPSASAETGWEDVLATIAPTPSAEENPLCLPMVLDSVHAREVDSRRSVPMHLASDPNASISRNILPLSADDHQMELLNASILRGWSPADGSQSLDLDDSSMLPQSLEDVWTAHWLASFPDPLCTQPAGVACQSPAPVPAMGSVQLQRSETASRASPVGTTDQITNDPERGIRFVYPPVQPLTCASPEPNRARSALQANTNVPSQTSRAKTPKSRPQPTPASATGASTARYVKAPRGGIPPHIARSVTKANVLRVENERKLIRDSSSDPTTGEEKKPSVLRRASKVERGTTKVMHDGGKNLFVFDDSGGKEGRAAKRMRR